MMAGLAGRLRASVRDRWASCWDAALLLQSSEGKHSGKSRLCPASHLPKGQRGLPHVLGEMGGLSVMMNETFNCGSKLLKVERSTPRRGIGLDAKKGVELMASDGTPGAIR